MEIVNGSTARLTIHHANRSVDGVDTLQSIFVAAQHESPFSHLLTTATFAVET